MRKLDDPAGANEKMAYQKQADASWRLSWEVSLRRGRDFPHGSRVVEKIYCALRIEGGWIGSSNLWVGGFGYGWSDAFALAVASTDKEVFEGELGQANGVSDLRISAEKSGPGAPREWIVSCSCRVDDAVKLIAAANLACEAAFGAVKIESLEHAASEIAQSSNAHPWSPNDAGYDIMNDVKHGPGEATSYDLWLSIMEGGALDGISRDPAKSKRPLAL